MAGSALALGAIALLSRSCLTNGATARAEPSRLEQIVARWLRLPALTAQERVEMERLNPRSPAEWKELEEEESFLNGVDPAPVESPAHAHHH